MFTVSVRPRGGRKLVEVDVSYITRPGASDMGIVDSKVGNVTLYWVDEANGQSLS